MDDAITWRERPFDLVPRLFLESALCVPSISPRLAEAIESELDYRRCWGEPVPDATSEEVIRRIELGPVPLDPESDSDSADWQIALLIMGVVVSAAERCIREERPADFVGNDGASLFDPG